MLLTPFVKDETRWDEINHRLFALEGKLTEAASNEKWHDDLIASMLQVRDELKELRLALLGDGAAVTGIVTRLDRIEQIQEVRRWQIRTIIAGFCAVIAKWAWDWLTTLKKP